MATLYPSNIDNDSTLPRVEDNVTEIGGSAINGLRDAVITLESAVGTNPQGNKTDLNTRVSVAIDADGNLKTSALEAKGLVTLPIYDAEIADNAGIQESKLDLDYSTTSLYDDYASLAVDVSATQTGYTTLSNALNNHVFGVNEFHDGYMIKINGVSATQYGIAGLKSHTVGDALNEFGQLLLSGNGTTTPHIDLTLPTTTKHRASEIGVDSSQFEAIPPTATNVQAALDVLDSQQAVFGQHHLDVFHANGVLKEVQSGTQYNPSKQLITSAAVSYVDGYSVVTVTGVTSFAALGVKTGCLLSIEGTVKDVGVYQIGAVGPVTAAHTLDGFPALNANQLSVFHVFQQTVAATTTASVFEPANSSSQSAPLVCSPRFNSGVADTITILNPDAARVVSFGFNGAIINGPGFSLVVTAGIGGGQYRTITIPGLNLDELGVNQAATVDARSVAN